jgi:hypothetical protein
LKRLAIVHLLVIVEGYPLQRFNFSTLQRGFLVFQSGYEHDQVDDE